MSCELITILIYQSIPLPALQKSSLFIMSNLSVAITRHKCQFLQNQLMQSPHQPIKIISTITCAIPDRNLQRLMAIYYQVQRQTGTYHGQFITQPKHVMHSIFLISQLFCIVLLHFFVRFSTCMSPMDTTIISSVEYYDLLSRKLNN